jgi:hypothetical protein
MQILIHTLAGEVMMKINLFKSRSKRETGIHFMYTPASGSPRIFPAEQAITCATHNRDTETSDASLFVNVRAHTGADNTPIAEENRKDIKVIGCHIESDSDEFEQHETAAVVQRIKHAYLTDVDSIIRHRLSYDTTIVVDLSIDNFSRVTKVDVLHPQLLPGDPFPEDINRQTAAWTFPTILRKGKCRIVFSEKL